MSCMAQRVPLVCAGPRHSPSTCVYAALSVVPCPCCRSKKHQEQVAHLKAVLEAEEGLDADALHEALGGNRAQQPVQQAQQGDERRKGKKKNKKKNRMCVQRGRAGGIRGSSGVCSNADVTEPYA